MKMSKTLYILTPLLIIGSKALCQIEKSASPDEKTASLSQKVESPSDDLLDSYIIPLEAQASAKEILSQKPTILKLQKNKQRIVIQSPSERAEIEARINREQAEKNRAKAKKEYIEKNYDKAPFGLFWNITTEEAQILKFDLTPTEKEDYRGVYIITRPDYEQQEFHHIIGIFGTQNHLWYIHAEGKEIQDKPDAAEILKLYKQYFEALKKKYGNAQEFFTPYKYTEELIEGEGETETRTTITKENPLGGADFLKELKEGKASLYATFETETLGITLSVSVNKNNQSYLSLDYKNLPLMKQEQESNLNNLMNEI